ncbi:mechanosensitive ion channel domain-containing protein [Rhodocyclaceae bacterium SMB388]
MPIRHYLHIALLFMLFTVSTVAPAEEQVRDPSRIELTTESLQAGRAAVESAANLDDATQTRLLELYDQAMTRLGQTQNVRDQSAALDEALRGAPQRIEELNSRLFTLGADTSETVGSLASAELDEVEAWLATQQQSLTRARDRLRHFEEELSRLLAGAGALNEQISERTAAMEQLEREMATSIPDEPELVRQARMHSLEASHALRRTERAYFRKTAANHGLLANLAQAEREYWTAFIAALGPRIEEVEALAQQMREAGAQQALAEAEQLRQRAAELPPELRAVAESNSRFREELERLVRDQQNVDAQLQRAATQLSEVSDDFERIRQRVDIVGRSMAIGDTLRKRRADLPSLQSHRRDTLARGEIISDATNRQLEIDDIFRGIGALEQNMGTVAREWAEGLPEEQRSDMIDRARELMSAHRSSLNSLQQSYGRFINSLTSLDIAERQLVTVAEAYVAFIDEQLLWIPSIGLISLFSDRPLPWNLWLGDPDNWVEVGRNLNGYASRNPATVLLGLLALVGLALFNRRTRDRLKAIDQSLNRIRSDSAMLTMKALACLTLKVTPVPLFMLGLALMLRDTADPFTLSVTAGLIKAALLLASLSLVRELCRDGSVGDRHFDWPADVRHALRRQTAWFIPFGVITSFLVGATAAPEPPPMVQALGSGAFIVLMSGAAIVVWRLLDPNAALWQALKKLHPGQLITQVHFLWYPLVLGTPVALALISLANYHYTAVHLEQRFQMTLWFLFGVFVLKELILRWLFVTERRLRFENAMRRRDELRAQRAAREEEGPADGEPEIAVEVPEVNFDSLGEQSKRLVRAGFLFTMLFGSWSIWANLIPALGFLDATELPFQAMRSIDGISTLVPVTLSDLIVGLFVIVVTVMAAKNLPGILEISLLQRLPLDAGARYAITALSQYLIVGIGILATFQAIGLQLSGLQWIIAALGVGLGFGLQEIVANFVSGIILLFERPIRVGDVVTIDNTTGVVTRIRIRATTITNYDKQELIVPNKEFITGRLINWTLTDRLNRLLIPVGLSYDGDVDKAMALMHEAAAEIPEVLADPAPLVSFESFDDNALLLNLRVHLPNLDNRLSVITALHKAINSKFKAAGLSIAFPQRDLHLDTMRPLDIRLHRVRTNEEPTP